MIIIKNKLIFGLLFLFLANIHLVNSQNDLTKSYLQLKGNVKSVKTSKFYVEYDYKGNQIKEIFYDPFYELECKYVYDDKGNQIIANWYSPNGLLKIKSKYKYDFKGNPIEETKYNARGEIRDIFTSKYDKKNNLIEWCWLYPDRSISFKYVYTYDNQKNKIEEKIYFGDSETHSYQYFYKYNTAGLVIEFKRFSKGNSKGITDTYKYSYDLKGNWIEQIRISGTLATEPKREIEYYD